MLENVWVCYLYPVLCNLHPVYDLDAVVTNCKPLDSTKPRKRAKQALLDAKVSSLAGGSNQESSKA
jgi:hypothetical protein